MGLANVIHFSGSSQKACDFPCSSRITSVSGSQVSEPRRGRVVSVDASAATLAPWPSEHDHPIGRRIQAWIRTQSEEEPEFEFSYEDSPFQVGYPVVRGISYVGVRCGGQVWGVRRRGSGVRRCGEVWGGVGETRPARYFIKHRSWMCPS